MPYCKKIVILNSLNKASDAKAVLQLEQNGVKLKCTLKTYREQYNSDLVVGLKINGNLLSPINVLAQKSSSFEFELNNNLDVSSEVSALICTKSEGEGINPILYGGSENEQVLIKAFNKQVVNYASVGVLPKAAEDVKVEAKQTQSALSEVASASDARAAEASLFESTDDEIESTIDNELNKVLSENKFEQKNNYAIANSIATDELATEPPIFYSLVEEQVAKMFETYPEDSELMEIIPNSRFAKVDFDGEGLYYSLGLLYGDDGSVDKICYAVKADKNATAPDDIKDYCFYFPVNDNDGYFILLQDARTGENLTDLAESF